MRAAHGFDVLWHDLDFCLHARWLDLGRRPDRIKLVLPHKSGAKSQHKNEAPARK